MVSSPSPKHLCRKGLFAIAERVSRQRNRAATHRSTCRFPCSIDPHTPTSGGSGAFFRPRAISTRPTRTEAMQA